MKSIIKIGVSFFVFFLTFCGPFTICSAQESPVIRAVVRIFPTAGNSVTGLLYFNKTEKGMRITGEIQGLKPGLHGFHIHEFGDLGSADGSSAGDHFNPTRATHGSPESAQKHIGDLGNILADDKGLAVIDLLDPQMELNGKYSIIGRAVVIHADPDDFKTQPTGRSGARIAVGVIGIAKKQP